MTQEPRMTMPIHEVRIGRVKACVWNRASGQEGEVYEVTVVRALDEGPEAGRDTPFLRRDDLLLAAKSLDVAHAFICRLEQSRGSPR